MGKDHTQCARGRVVFGTDVDLPGDTGQPDVRTDAVVVIGPLVVRDMVKQAV